MRARGGQAEDRQALELAGRTPVNLDFLGDQYRPVAQLLEEVVDELRARLAPVTAVLAPAGIGGHPDHLLARSAALRLHDVGFRVALYAELPHAIQRGWPPEIHRKPRDGPLGFADVAWERALVQIGRVRDPSAVHTLSAQQSHNKIRAVRVYHTQLDALNAMA